MKPVSVDIVTGFLGSGKTTLLKHVLEHGLSSERVAVVVNELGEVGIDGPVLTGLDAVERMVELDSGCVCCSIDELRFDMAMQELVHEADPTLILLETTGVAEPQATAARVRQAGLAVDAVITTVDVAHFSRALRFGGVARRQVAGADFVVLTKTDVAGDAARRRVERRVARIQPRASVLAADHGGYSVREWGLPAVRAARVCLHDRLRRADRDRERREPGVPGGQRHRGRGHLHDPVRHGVRALCDLVELLKHRAHSGGL